MGALHEGHLSLVRQAAHENDVVVVSIFVNPTQFGPNEDFKKYPRTLQQDTRLLETLKLKKDRLVIFAPSVLDVYPSWSSSTFLSSSSRKRGSSFEADSRMDSRIRGNDGTGVERQTLVRANRNLASVLCGAYRTGHFDGVCTVVLKLFNMVGPCAAYFGEKDFQQLRVLEAMVAEFHVPVQIKRCAIIREADGLAMSSRNRYLNAAEREAALTLNRALVLGRTLFQLGERDAKVLLRKVGAELKAESGLRVQYLDLRSESSLLPIKTLLASGRQNVRLFVAAYVGKTRLIDNEGLG